MISVTKPHHLASSYWPPVPVAIFLPFILSTPIYTWQRGFLCSRSRQMHLAVPSWTPQKGWYAIAVGSSQTQWGDGLKESSNWKHFWEKEHDWYTMQSVTSFSWVKKLYLACHSLSPLTVTLLSFPSTSVQIISWINLKTALTFQHMPQEKQHTLKVQSLLLNFSLFC